MPAGKIGDQVVCNVLQNVSASKSLGQRLESPRSHPFPARMPLPLVEHLVGGLTRQGAVVLDPMVGSGTTAIAAKRLGRTAIGFDRDPLAVLIARAATQTYERGQLEAASPRILGRAKELVRGGKIVLAEALRDAGREDREFIRYWFPVKSQHQLLALVRAVDDLGLSKSTRDFSLMVLSTLVIAKSTGASYALDISRSRPHKVPEKPVVLPFDNWLQRFSAAVSKHLFFEPGGGLGSAQIRAGDARALDLEACSADLVITSPPYLNAIDYLRSHKFSLVWMGHGLGALRELRGTMIGTERGLTCLDGLPAEVEERVRHVEGRQQGQVRRYLSDLGKTAGEIRRVLKPGGLAVIVVGPTMINERRTDAQDLLAKIGQQHGLRFVEGVTRHISALRRSLPAPGSVGVMSPLAGRMRREVLVALRKE